MINASDRNYQIKTSSLTEGYLQPQRGMLGSPLLNIDFEWIDLTMGANGLNCNNRRPIYFEPLANSKLKNTSVYQLLAAGSSAGQVEGMKWVPCLENQDITSSTIINKTRKANNRITSSSEILPNKNVLYRAGVLVELIDGFEASGDIFEARIEPCDYESKTVLLKSSKVVDNISKNSYSFNESRVGARNEKQLNPTEIETTEEFYSYPTIIGDDNILTITYSSYKVKNVSISLFDFNGKIIAEVYKNNVEKILNEKIQISPNISTGLYVLKLSNGEHFYTSKIIKL